MKNWLIAFHWLSIIGGAVIFAILLDGDLSGWRPFAIYFTGYFAGSLALGFSLLAKESK